MDESQAYHELHPGAVYMHEGVLYEVLKLDLVSRTAEAVPFDGNYYTVPSGSEETRILQTFQEEDMGRTRIHFGDINVNEVISMYKKLQFHNHQNLGYVDLTQPLQKSYDTESTWIDIPKNVAEIYRSLLVPNRMGELVLNDHFEGLCYAVKNAAMMTTMTERDDIDAVVSNNAVIPDGREEQVVSLYIYDKYEGGLPSAWWRAVPARAAVRLVWEIIIWTRRWCCGDLRTCSKRVNRRNLKESRLRNPVRLFRKVFLSIDSRWSGVHFATVSCRTGKAAAPSCGQWSRSK